MPILARAASLAALCLALTPLAHASLGDSATTVSTDQVRMMAARATLPGTAYRVEELTLPGGTLVREFVAPSGTVFGVAWHGPAMPDIQQILGVHADEARQGVLAVRAVRGGLGPVSVASGSLVLYSGGHMGHYRGRAYLPASIPSNVTADDIR
jgi:hypothetical protein